MYKALIVDDDLANINLIDILLKKYCPNVTVNGKAQNSVDFIDQLLTKSPDILLLDIDLGEAKNSLEILEEIDTTGFEIIIISSHEDYGIKAINEYHVSDYLIKPINALSLSKAIIRAEKTIDQKRAFLQKVKESSNSEKKIIGIPTASTIDIIEIDNILYLEADGKYTVFNLCNDVKKISSRNIGAYEKILPSNIFFRIHHKFIVNTSKIININRSDGNYCVLSDGKMLSIAKRRTEDLRKFLQI